MARSYVAMIAEKNKENKCMNKPNDEIAEWKIETVAWEWSMREGE